MIDNRDHEYAGCQDELCQRCEGYGDGYTDGKSKAFFEVATVEGHWTTCGCNPCGPTRARVARVLQEVFRQELDAAEQEKGSHRQFMVLALGGKIAEAFGIPITSDVAGLD